MPFILTSTEVQIGNYTRAKHQHFFMLLHRLILRSGDCLALEYWEWLSLSYVHFEANLENVLKPTEIAIGFQTPQILVKIFMAPLADYISCLPSGCRPVLANSYKSELRSPQFKTIFGHEATFFVLNGKKNAVPAKVWKATWETWWLG